MMRKACLILLTLAASVAIHAQEANTDSLTAYVESGHKRYGLKSAIVNYQVTGMRRGGETLYFDHWGWREAKYTSVILTLYDMQQEEKRLEMLLGTVQYSIDLLEKEGSVMHNDQLKELVESDSIPDTTNTGQAELKQLGGVMTGTENILGRPCQVWDMPELNVKVWMWKGIPLKMAFKYGGIPYVSEAERIRENADIPEEKFQIPQNISLKKSTIPEHLIDE